LHNKNIKKILLKYNNPEKFDRLAKANSIVNKTKNIMEENIIKLSENLDEF